MVSKAHVIALVTGDAWLNKDVTISAVRAARGEKSHLGSAIYGWMIKGRRVSVLEIVDGRPRERFIFGPPQIPEKQQDHREQKYLYHHYNSGIVGELN